MFYGITLKKIVTEYIYIFINTPAKWHNFTDEEMLTFPEVGMESSEM